MKFVTIIPARGGSKRLPGKNIKQLHGKPLIAYSIEQSLKCDKICQTFVSTDSEEIAKISLDLGAEILHRSSKLSGDNVTTAAVLCDAAHQLIDGNIAFDYIVLLQPTNPLRPDGLIEQAIAKLEKDHLDGVMTVTLNQKKLGKIENGQFIPWSYKFGQRSQDLEPLYYENGLLYITSREQILNGNILTKNTAPFIVDHIYASVDIDTIEDFEYAEFILKTHPI